MSPSRTALSAKCEFALHREKAKSLFSSINRYRASKNVPALTWDDTLYSYCVLHNIDMHSSLLKSSDFSMVQSYNENVAHVPGSSKKILDLWNSRSGEGKNMLCNGTKYSAISVYGDDDECYATQIFTEHRPKGNDKIASMKTQESCDTCKRGKTITKGIASAALKADSIAVTKLRKKDSPPLAKAGARAKTPAKKTKPKSNQPLAKKTGNKGHPIRDTIAAGMKSLGAALDKVLPAKEEEPAPKRPAPKRPAPKRPAPKRPSRRTQRINGPENSGTPRKEDGCGRLNRPDENHERDLFEICPVCKHRRSRRKGMCGTCSTYM